MNSTYQREGLTEKRIQGEGECIMTDDALDAVIDIFSDTTGIRDLEQAAEHIVANALYQIEVDHLEQVTFTGEMVRELLL